MIKKLLCLATILTIYINSYSQVGVNNVAPNSTLEVSASKTGSIIDVNQTVGFQAPRLTLAELISVSGSASSPKYGNNQTGAIIYITNLTGGNTGANASQRELINEIGYYYFTGSVWTKFITDSKEPWFVTKSLSTDSNLQASSNTQNIYQMGNVTIGNSELTENSSALEVNGSTTKSVLHLKNSPITNDPKITSNIRPGVNYKRLSTLLIDDNGKVVKAYDPSHQTSSDTFDGAYTIPIVLSTATLAQQISASIALIDVKAESVLKFDIYTNLSVGTPGVGANILSTISFGFATGFKESNTAMGLGNATMSNSLLSILHNETTANSTNNYVGSITYSLDITSGIKLKIFTANGILRAVGITTASATATTISLNVMNSKKYR